MISAVLSVSSGAALRGSPLSGGYAGAKATVRFVSQYAAAESERQALGIRFTAVLPSLTPATALGLEGAAAYAAYEGISLEAFVARMGQPLTPDAVGAALLALATGAEQPEALAYTLSALAAAVYVLATWCLLRGGRWVRVGVWACTVELVGVLVVGAASYVVPDAFPDKTVWSHFGQGYGFVPLVLPVLGLLWFRKLEREAAAADRAEPYHLVGDPAAAQPH